jgi:predicted enzyme related to lactoylglutathione lyase
MEAPMSDHKIVHVEFAAADPAALSKFYGDAFGWKISAVPDFNYYMFDTGGGEGGGFPTPGGQFNFKVGEPMVYIGTDDIEASLAKITSLGGKAESGAVEIPGQGWFAIFHDPAGNRAALYKGLPPAE